MVEETKIKNYSKCVSTLIDTYNLSILNLVIHPLNQNKFVDIKIINYPNNHHYYDLTQMPLQVILCCH
jgi:hypothetical protein